MEEDKPLVNTGNTEETEGKELPHFPKIQISHVNDHIGKECKSVDHDLGEKLLEKKSELVLTLESVRIEIHPERDFETNSYFFNLF